MDRKALKRDGGIRNYNAPTVINDIFLNPGSSHIRNKQSATEIIIMMYSFWAPGGIKVLSVFNCECSTFLKSRVLIKSDQSPRSPCFEMLLILNLIATFICHIWLHLCSGAAWGPAWGHADVTFFFFSPNMQQDKSGFFTLYTLLVLFCIGFTFFFLAWSLVWRPCLGWFLLPVSVVFLPQHIREGYS